jgi:hypothetical protein
MLGFHTAPLFYDGKWPSHLITATRQGTGRCVGKRRISFPRPYFNGSLKYERGIIGRHNTDKGVMDSYRGSGWKGEFHFTLEFRYLFGRRAFGVRLVESSPRAGTL